MRSINLAEIEQRGVSTSLDRILELRNQPPAPTRVTILRRLAEKIDAGEITGDLNPENVLISGDLSAGEIAVALRNTDSRFVPEEELATDGRIPEAARYLSPERILGTSTDVRSHEFSLGIVAYEFICGKKPFDAPDLSQLFYRVCTEKPVPAEPQVSRDVNAVLARALARNREQRFADCGHFVEALTAALKGEGSEQPVPAISVPAPAPSGLSTTRLRRRYGDDEPTRELSQPRKRKFGLILALCLAALGLALFFVRYKPKPNLPVQVLDTNSGPATPPPVGDQITPARKAETPPMTAMANKKRNSLTPVPNLGSSTVVSPLTSSVEFLTDPPAAQIVVDGNPSQSCSTPCTLSLPAGRHTLSTDLSGFSRAQRIFTLPQDKSLFVPLSRRMGTLVVTSVPSGSTVVVDGRDYGVTPATLHLPPGEHRLLLINGARQHSDMVNVEADAIQAKALTW